MGRPAFTRFLTRPEPTVERGVHWGQSFVTWDNLRARGRERSGSVRSGQAYLVDPTVGVESFASLFAVATVPGTTLIWAARSTVEVPGRELGPALHEIDAPVADTAGRPLWGVCTSGSTGAAKVAIGHADLWELIALHYQSAMFAQVCPAGLPAAFATNLPLQFSAAFFMTVLPSLFLCRDLVVFPSHDWSPALRHARDGETVVLSVPALAAAACLALQNPVDAHRVSLFLGGGHISAGRVRQVRDTFLGASVTNIYGTAETGAIAVDHAPGHSSHVGHPIHGKAVWIDNPDDRGVGPVTVAGIDCCRYLWQPGGPGGPGTVTPTGATVGGTDYGRFDEDGHLCLEGRIDGAEKLMGMLVHPRATERHLLSLPGVVDAKVRVHRAESGLEHLAATVVGNVAEDAVRAYCAVLPSVEQPSRIECVAEEAALAAYSAHGKLR
jgi:acyl-coenzyme A synthetase/AMP-(fatty) acid ligase